MWSLFAAVPVVLWVFADGDHGFAASGDSLQWEWAVPSSGPLGMSEVWATNASGFYLNDSTDFLEVPLPDLSLVAEPVLTVRHWYNIQAGDAAYFEVDDGAGWTRISPIFGYPDPAGFTGSSQGFIDSSVDLAGLATGARLRLVMSADASVASDGWYLSEVGVFDGDATPPDIEPVSLPVDTEVISQGYPVQLQVQDDHALASVDLFYVAGSSSEVQLPMVDLGGGLFEAEIPPQAPDTVVDWHVVADDGTQTSQWPPVGDESFRVFLPAPTQLEVLGAAGRLVTNELELSWQPPTSIHTVLSYRVEAADDSDGPWVVFDTTAQIPLTPDGPRSFQVRAVFDVGIGDAVGPVDVAAEVPILQSVTPSSGWQGDRVHVEVRGQGLYLATDSSLEFGLGVVVESVEVVDADTVVAVLAIAPDADVGTRAVTVVGSQGRFTFDGMFLVKDGVSAPRVVSVAPATVRQGDRTQVVVEVSTPFAGPVVVEPHDYLLVVQEPEVEAEIASLSLVVDGRTPPGLHTLALDDGNRLWTVDLEVKERIYLFETVCGGCNAAPNRQGFAAWLLLLLVVMRRQC